MWEVFLFRIMEVEQQLKDVSLWRASEGWECKPFSDVANDNPFHVRSFSSLPILRTGDNHCEQDEWLLALTLGPTINSTKAIRRRITGCNTGKSDHRLRRWDQWSLALTLGQVIIGADTRASDHWFRHWDYLSLAPTLGQVITGSHTKANDHWLRHKGWLLANLMGWGSPTLTQY